MWGSKPGASKQTSKHTACCELWRSELPPSRVLAPSTLMSRPITKLAQALELSDDARVITLGRAPYRIVHTNKSEPPAPAGPSPAAHSAACAHGHPDPSFCLCRTKQTAGLSHADAALLGSCRLTEWSQVTGYKFTEIANMTSSFLQGPETEVHEEQQLIRACSDGKRAKARLLNYNKAGEPFFNALECFPLRDRHGNLTHFCGVLHAEMADTARYKRRVGPAPQLAAHAAAALVRQQRVALEQEGQPAMGMGGGGYGRRRGPGSTSSTSSTQSEPGVSRRSTREPLSESSSPRAGGSRRASRDDGYGAPAAPTGGRPKRTRGHSVTLQDALNNTTDAIVMTQPFPPYAITHVNAPWCEMCGYTQEEVEGHPNSILQGPETDEEILADLMSSVHRGEPTSATLVNYKKGGQRFVNQVQVMPVYNEETSELEQFMAMLNEVDGV